MLGIAASLHGHDFVPFQEHILHKPARLGASSAWHQDPSAAWDADWAAGKLTPYTCGTNFHVSLFHCTPENALWILPNSHTRGRLDPRELSADVGGSERLGERY